MLKQSFSHLAGLCLALLMLSVASTASAELLLKEANFVALPGKKVELRFDFDAPPPLPKSYQIDRPSRIVMDLWGVTSDLAEKNLAVATGVVKGVSFAQVEGRLRIVTNLFESAGYRAFTDQNSLFVVIGEGDATITQKRKPTKLEQAKAAANPDAKPDPDTTRITGIDFKRVEEGMGRVVISLSDDKAGVDIQEEGNNVVVNLLGASLSRALEQRVDVQDFATPVLFIDSMGAGENTTVLVKPGAEPYNYLAYQTGTQLVLDFKPVTEQENDERQKELFPYSGEPIDLNFQDVELRSVLQIIAEVAELNLVVSDEVEGNITLRLKNVPWDQALDIVLRTEGLDKRVLGNVLLVAKAEEIAKREEQELENSKKIEELAPLQTQYIQVDFRKASEMRTHLEDAKLITPERGFIMADDETNVLMVRDTEKALQEIRKTLRKFDVEVQQVLIEARLVTARSSITKDLGVKWGFGYEDIDNGKGIILNNSIGGVDFANPPTTAGLAVDLGATALNPTSFAIGIKPGASSLLALELSALQSDGQAEIISQPKIVTMNGKTASIESGREIPFQTVEDGEVKIEFKDVVLRLEVTPRINPGDRIAMDLLIKQDSLGDTTFNGQITIDNNELVTSVVVPDGQTIVLGGVFQNETSETINKTPLLGDLPVLGNLFKNKENTGVKTELLIFITPKLIRESLSIN
ncbi:type IV pilus secretin PilQ [Pontibacterium sp.]|uniref:type IV pilus secretin PilQ n=1 Tax=Pontibacterium sp. TaxID=2036026 RepID=UPI003563D856